MILGSLLASTSYFFCSLPGSINNTNAKYSKHFFFSLAHIENTGERAFCIFYERSMPVALIILKKEVWNGWFLPWNIFRICVYIHAPLRRHRGNSGGSFKLLSLTQTTYVWGGVFFAWEELRGVCWCCLEIFLLCLHKWGQEDWLTLVVKMNKFGSEINRRLRPVSAVVFYARKGGSAWNYSWERKQCYFLLSPPLVISRNCGSIATQTDGSTWNYVCDSRVSVW